MMTAAAVEEQETPPLVSVVMPCSDPAWLHEAVMSVLRQTMADLELLVIADGVDIEGVLPADDRLHVHRFTDSRGAAVARAWGIAAARGRWVAFCDADDLWAPDKLKVQLADPEASDATILCTAYQEIDEQGRALGDPLPVPRRMTYQDLLWGCPIGNSTVMFDTTKVGRLLPPPIPLRCDYALWLEILRGGGAAIACPASLVRYRVHPGGLSANKLRAALWQWRVLRQEGLGPAKAFFCWLVYARRGLIGRLRRVGGTGDR